MYLWLVLANFSFSLGLTVLIWLIQILHYPFFSFISDSLFKEAMIFHQNRISLIVMPLMLGELALAIRLCFYGRPLFWIQIGLILLLWSITFLQFVPMHQNLLINKDLVLINKLVNLNWTRTLLWSIKAILSFFILYQEIHRLK